MSTLRCARRVGFIPATNDLCAWRMLCYAERMTTAEVIQMTPRSDRREAIAAPIRAHLAVSKISGADLARRIGLTQPQVSRRLSGRLPFTSDDLTAIADELNLTVAELVQMPQRGTIGGGTSFVGVTPIRPRVVGRTGLEPVTDGSWVAPVTPIRKAG